MTETPTVPISKHNIRLASLTEGLKRMKSFNSIRLELYIKILSSTIQRLRTFKECAHCQFNSIPLVLKQPILVSASQQETFDFECQTQFAILLHFKTWRIQPEDHCFSRWQAFKETSEMEEMRTMLCFHSRTYQGRFSQKKSNLSLHSSISETLDENPCSEADQ